MMINKERLIGGIVDETKTRNIICKPLVPSSRSLFEPI
jgi:hypothetical protein